MSPFSFLVGRMRTKWGWWIALSSLVILVALVVFNTVVIPSSFEGMQTVPIKSDRCVWNPKLPVYFNIRTKLGVNYDAGHWFHMAENIMTMHSVLRSKGQLANASQIYFNFDHKEFPENLNGMTRFITFLGIAAPGANVETLRYMSDRKLWRASTVGDVFLYDVEPQRSSTQDQWLRLTSDEPSSRRFVQLASATAPSLSAAIDSAAASTAVATTSAAPAAHAHGKSRTLCVKYGGTIGGLWPTIQRGHWFPNAGDVDSFREKIRNVCPVTSTPQRKRTLLLYQRDLSRRLLNQADALERLGRLLPSDIWDINVVMHSSSRSPCELYELLHNVDVLLTPHGFQSMLLILMAPGKVLFEVFPYKYYKPAYSPFGREFGVWHGGVMSTGTNALADYVLRYITTPTCMQIKQCRVHARDQDVILSQHGVDRLGRLIEVGLGKALLRSIGVTAASNSSSLSSRTSP